MEDVDGLRADARADGDDRAVVRQREEYEDICRGWRRERELGAVEAQRAEMAQRRLAVGALLHLRGRLRAAGAATTSAARRAAGATAADGRGNVAFGVIQRQQPSIVAQLMRLQTSKSKKPAQF